MRNKEKVLIINLPHVALYDRFPYMELNFGASCFAGALEEIGEDVDYYDLNIALNAIKKEELKKKDLLVLSNLEHLNDYFKSPSQKSVLTLWSQKLLKNFNQEKYKYIGLSIEKRYSNIEIYKGALHFGIIIADLLSKKYKVPIFCGGKIVFEYIKKNYLKQINSKLSSVPINYFFIDSKPEHFIVYLKYYGIKKLKSMSAKKGKIVTNKIISDETASERKNKKFLNYNNPYGISFPKFDIKNINNLYFDLKKVLPKSIQNKRVRLKKIKPICLLPYKFSIGCPFSCSFCANGTVNNFMALPAGKVVDNIERTIEKYGISNFRFYNNNINFGKNYVLELCQKIIKRKLNIKFSDSANLRFASPEIFHALREAGCIKLWFGAETVSPGLLKYINKEITPEMIYNGLMNSHKAGIWNSVNFIVNFPHESEKDFWVLKDFIENNINIIDDFKCKIFELYKTANIFIKPNKYGIRIIKKVKGDRDYKYNEIDGLMWPDIVIRGKERRDEISKILNNNYNSFYSNDYLFFGLYQEYNNKKEIKEIMSEINSSIIKDSQRQQIIYPSNYK